MKDIAFAPPEPGNVLLLIGLPGGSDKIYDRSAYGNIGAITGAIWTRLPSGLWVLSFDGADDLVEANGVAAGSFFGGEHTIICWAALDAWTSYQTIVAAGRTSTAGPLTELYYDYTSGQFKVLNGNSGVVETNIVSSLNTYSNDSSFHLFAMCTDGDGKITSFSINGKHQGAAMTNILDMSAIDKFYLGQLPYTSPNTNPFAGKIALARVYNRLLTALEIQNIFNQEKHLFGVW